MGSKFVNLIIAFSIGVTIVIGLLAVQKGIIGDQSFTRLIPPHTANIKGITTLTGDSYYIAGLSTDSVYLAKFTNPTQLLVSDYQFHHSRIVELPILQEYKLSVGSRIAVEYPEVYVVDLILSSVFRARLDELQFNRIKLHESNLTAFTLLPDSTSVMTSFDPDSGSNVLVKVQLSSDGINTYQSYKLAKQVDGFFCTQGTIRYSSETALIYYIFSYRNEILCLDMSLNLVARYHTIDTVTTARIEIDTLYRGSMAKVTFKSPPLMVNKFSCVHGNRLYVNSHLMAGNEDSEKFSNAAVIDVYEELNGKYKFSFYLPNQKGHRLNDFRIYDRKMVAVHGPYVLSYKLAR